MKKFLNINSLALLIVLAGVVLRLRQYFYCRSLWIDEAMISYNILNRNFAELIDKLAFEQAAPFGFLIIEKTLTTIFGCGEIALRSFPMLCGIISLFLIYYIGKKLSKGSYAIWPLLIIALSYPLIYYSNEVKQYMSDMLISMIAILVFFRLSDSEDARKLIISTIVSSILIWFSHPVIFIISAGISYYLINSLIQKKQLSVVSIAVLIFPILLSFILLYSFNLKNVSGNNFLTEYWSYTFPILFPLNYSNISHSLGLIADMFRHPLGLNFSLITGLLFCYGIFVCTRKKGALIILLLLPVVMTFFAAALGRYPFSERFLIFLAPSLCLILGFALDDIYKRRAVGKILAVTVFAMVIFTGAKVTAFHFVVPEEKEETRELLQSLSEIIDEDQYLYIYYGAQPAYLYYRNCHIPIPNKETIFGEQYREDRSLYISDLNKIVSPGRQIWYVFSHNYRQEQQLILNEINRTGQIRDSLKYKGASAFLQICPNN